MLSCIFFVVVVGAVPASGMMVLRQTADCDRTYVVQPGDFCDEISAENNVSTFQLAHVNPQINTGCTNIFGGQTLCLGVTGQDCTTVHVVVQNDTVTETCSSIADDAGISIDTLKANNLNLDANCDIYGGEVLCTASTVFPYTT